MRVQDLIVPIVGAAVIMASFAWPALIVQSIRLRTHGWIIAAASVTTPWIGGMAVMLVLATTSSPYWAIIPLYAGSASLIGFVASLFGMWLNPRR